MENVNRTFSLFATEQGEITIESLEAVARSIGENMTREELAEMLRAATIGNEQKETDARKVTINQDSFLKLMKNANLL